MSDQTYTDIDARVEKKSLSQAQVWDTKAILWSFPQPILVLGSMFLVATMFTEEWMDHKLYSLIMMMLPVPILLIAERIWTKTHRLAAQTR